MDGSPVFLIEFIIWKIRKDIWYVVLQNNNDNASTSQEKENSRLSWFSEEALGLFLNKYNTAQNPICFCGSGT